LTGCVIAASSRFIDDRDTQVGDSVDVPRATRALVERGESASAAAAGLRVPKPLGDFLILAHISASGGDAVAATDGELMLACREMAGVEGIMAAPVLFKTGGGYTYLEARQSVLAG
jgi:hypothetical protein